MNSTAAIGIRDRGAVRGGVALLEVVVSAASCAVLLAGLATAVSLALRAGDSNQGPWSRSARGTEAAWQITRELQLATGFNDAWSNANRVEFTIPDQTGDGQPETVRYTWSGGVGGTLTRTFNGGAAETIASNVHAFTLRYRTRTVPPAPVLNESNETQWLDLNNSNTGFLNGWIGVTENSWIGQYFAPTLPSSAVSWRITRVQLYLNQVNSTKGIALVRVHTPNESHHPSGTLLGQAIFSESEFNSNWFTATFENAGALAPGEGACVVVASGNGTSETVADVRAGLLSFGSSGTYAVTTSDSGATWSNSTWTDLWLRVWGRYTTQSAGTGATRSYLTGIDVTIQVGPSAAAAITTAVQTVNEPEVSGP